MIAYLDNSATSRPCQACIQAIDHMLTESWGNPSSLHRMGIDAMKEVISARSKIAQSIGAAPEEIIFTSGGTEANNMAVFGAVKAKKRSGNKIVTTAIEHESVLKCAQELEKKGFEVVYLKPDRFGNISRRQLLSAVDSKTILVSMMHTNNEVGSQMPVEELRRAVKNAGSPALIHIDCVQAYGKTNINIKKLGADLITISAHKIHGPKGIGALYISKNARLTSQNFARSFGGGQERRIRPGTECAPLIAGFGAAAAEIDLSKAQYEKIRSLNEYTKSRLAAIDGILLNSAPEASPYIINICVPTFMRSQTILQELSANYGVCVSSGSACAGGERSYVLQAMGLDFERIDKSIRISFCRYNTKEDADRLADALADLIKKHPQRK